jgi:hypothetical protein
MERMLSSVREAQAATIEALIAASGRTAGTPIRRTFVQQGPQREPVPGPLHRLVRTHNERALDLFLLHRLCATAAPWDVKRPAKVWARALGLEDGTSYGTDAVSKAWAKLVDFQLVTRTREARQAKITSLDESGSGAPYTAPETRYFSLPFGYWTDAWHLRLSLAGKAVLLIARSLAPGFPLPQEHAPKWYGISPDTMGRGLNELIDGELLRYQTIRRTDWLSADGYRKERRYELLGAFARKKEDDQ